jgi:hypothetical protein
MKALDTLSTAILKGYRFLGHSPCMIVLYHGVMELTFLLIFFVKISPNKALQPTACSGG